MFSKLRSCLVFTFLLGSIMVYAENPADLTDNPPPVETPAGLSIPPVFDQSSPDWPRFDQVVDGHHVVIPYYDPTVTEASWERKKFDLDAYTGLERILVQLVDDLLVKRKSVLQLTLYPFKFYNFVTKTKAESAELIKKGIGKQMGDDFVKDALVILKDMHKYPDPDGKARAKMNRSKEEKRQEAKEISEDFRKFLNLFREVIQASQVGKYLDWQKMMIDGKPVAQEAARFYNYFENNGYSGALWVMNGVINLLEKIKG